jgi:hypothetical protein
LKIKFPRINGVTPKRRLSYTAQNNSNGSNGTPARFVSKLDMPMDQQSHHDSTTPEVLRKSANLAEPSPQSHPSEHYEQEMMANKENEGCASSNSSTPLCIKRKSVKDALCGLNSNNNSPLMLSSNNLNASSGYRANGSTPTAAMNDR